MSESCPKCGANRTQFEGQTSWECGSYQSLLGGSHIKRPAFKLIESEHCLCRTALAAATKRAEESARIIAGCRDLIATLRTRIAEVEQENARLREALEKWMATESLGLTAVTLAEARTLTAALLAKPEGAK